MQIGIMGYQQKRIMLEGILDKGYALIGVVSNDVVKVYKKEEITNEFLELRNIFTGEIATINKIRYPNYGDFIRISNQDIGKMVELVFSSIILKEKKVIRGRVYF